MYNYPARFTEEERKLLLELIVTYHSNINSLLRKLVRDQYKRELRKREKKIAIDQKSA